MIQPTNTQEQEINALLHILHDTWMKLLAAERRIKELETTKYIKTSMPHEHNLECRNGWHWRQKPWLWWERFLARYFGWSP